MKYLITFFLFIPVTLSAMDQAPSAPKPKPVEIEILPVIAHMRANKNEHTLCGVATYNDNPEMEWLYLNKGCSYKGTELTLTEIIPDDKTQQLTVLFSLKPAQDKSTYKGAVIGAAYGSRIPLGDQRSDVRYLLRIPTLNLRAEDNCCSCPNNEHQNPLLTWLLAQPSAESNAQKLCLDTTIAPNDQDDDGAMKE